MEFLNQIFNGIIYRPLFNLMIFFYNIIPGNDIGIAIILVTLFVRILLYPMNEKAIKSQMQIQKIQPKVKKLQKKFKDNKEKQAKALMELYQKEKVNPFSGCFPILIQLPILIAIYHVSINGFKSESLLALYPFIHNPGQINTFFVGIVDLSKKNLYLALIAASMQYFQTKTLMKVKDNTSKEDKNIDKYKDEDKSTEKTQDFAQSMTKQMVYIMPVVTFVFAMNFPSGLALYWAITTLFAIVQQYIIMGKLKEEKEEV